MTATTRPLDIVDVRLAAILFHRPWLVLVNAEYHDQVGSKAEAIRIAEAVAREGKRVVVLRVEGKPEEWGLVKRWPKT